MLSLEIIGQRVEFFRKRKEISQEEMAKFLGCSKTLYSYWESGERTVNLENLLKVCEILEIPPAVLFLAEKDVLHNSEINVFSWDVVKWL